MSNYTNIAVVAGTGSYNDLGVIRSCGEQGIPVFYITTNETHILPIHKSRYITKTYFIDMQEDTFINTLHTIIADYTTVLIVIFPTADITALYLDHNQDKLKGKCFFSNAAGQLSTLMDKYEMGGMARNAGLLVPDSVKVNILKEDVNYDTIQYPCIIKPLKSIEGEKSDITIAGTAKELKEILLLLNQKGYENILIQKFISKENSREIAFTGISLQNKEVIIHGQINKIRIRGNGSTVFGVYIPEINHHLIPLLKEYVKSTGYTGIFDIELLEKDKRYYFIECNFRNGAYGYAVTKAGFNMPFSVYLDYTGKKIPVPKKQKKIIFMEERSDFLNVLDKTITLFHWLKDVFLTNCFLVFNIKDIRPVIRIPYFIKKHFK
ncbi:MAG: hypothetical protein LBO74_15925 [Candidatus Symbiothrix sp.]|nr:hypothetical protein [Candidatus Symbiothrix sp.]